MDLKAYFSDLRREEAALDKIAESQDGIVYVTSVFHREKNSTSGSTLSATPRNAARVITDGTHRRATEMEVKGFLDHQQKELEKSVRMEQIKKKQYIVVVDQHQPSQAGMLGDQQSLTKPVLASK